MTVHVSNEQGKGLQGAAITVKQVSKDFPFGSAISKTILGNLPYQVLKSTAFRCQSLSMLCCQTINLARLFINSTLVKIVVEIDNVVT